MSVLTTAFAAGMTVLALVGCETTKGVAEGVGRTGEGVAEGVVEVGEGTVEGAVKIGEGTVEGAGKVAEGVEKDLSGDKK